MKVLITLLLTIVFLQSEAQHYFGLRAEVGGGSRILRSDFPELSAMYNNHELTAFTLGLAADYSYGFNTQWRLQTGVAFQNKGYRTAVTDQYLGEFKGDDGFVDIEGITQMKHRFMRFQAPLIINYLNKQSHNWRLIVGVGPSINLNVDYTILTDYEEGESQAKDPNQYGTLREFLPGIQAQFGWVNTLPSGSEIHFLIRYDQDLVPALDAPVRRYLYALNFALCYQISS